MTMEEAIQQLDGAEMMLLNREFIQFNQAIIMAISALRTQQKQENECAKCSGIVYRQTDSGKIIPVGQRCGAKITPPCYVPDGDGCAYQIYGDNNDEPIDRCKSCPLCQSDKIRHKQESVHNDPLVLDELRQMRGEPVWCKELECYGIVKMEKVGSWANELFLVGTWLRQHGASCQILATLAPAASGGGTEMNFKQFIRWRLVCFVQTHIRHCQECLGSNGHCQECNDWHHLFRRDWQRTYWRRKC